MFKKRKKIHCMSEGTRPSDVTRVMCQFMAWTVVRGSASTNAQNGRAENGK